MVQEKVLCLIYYLVLKPDKGQILADGLSINRNLNNWQKISYVPQTIYLSDTNILEI